MYERMNSLLNTLYLCSLCAVVCGVVVGRWVVAALGSGLYGVVGGMMVVVVVAFAMRLIRGRIATVVCGDGNEGSREREDQETWTGKY